MKKLGLLLMLMVLPLAARAGDSYNLGASVVTAGNYVHQMAANANLTGTDTVLLANGSQKLTLTANETLTIALTNLPAWQSTHSYALNTQIFPTTNNTAGNYFQVTACSGGCPQNSGGSQPNWASSCGAHYSTCTDGSVTWTNEGPVLLTSASATSLPTFNFQICQNGTGNFTLAFAAGTGVSNLYWSGGAQPAYTLTANNGDMYTCTFDGTNLRCQETMSNQPC